MVKRLFLVISVFALLVFAAGCDKMLVQSGNQITGASVLDDSGSDGGSDGGDEELVYLPGGSDSGNSGEDGSDDESGTQSGFVPVARNLDPCAGVVCDEGTLCYNGYCKTPECTTDADCVRDDPCLPPKCEFAGHPNAFCSTDRITRPRNGDGCCPSGADLDTDTDCKPVCGNHKCEVDENVENCEADCLHAGPGPSQAPPPSYGPYG